MQDEQKFLLPAKTIMAVREELPEPEDAEEQEQNQPGNLEREHHDHAENWQPDEEQFLNIRNQESLFAIRRGCTSGQRPSYYLRTRMRAWVSAANSLAA